jgi:hypothetical protein
MYAAMSLTTPFAKKCILGLPSPPLHKRAAEATLAQFALGGLV